MSGAPDLIVTAARLLDAEGDAVAVTGDRIAAVGESAALLRSRGPATRVINAPGGLLCPGFHDAHAHLGATGVARLEVDLHGLDAGGVRDALAAAAATKAPGRWVIGRGFDPAAFPPEGTSARTFLDAACPDHPVLARSHDYHAAALNTAALVRTMFLPEPVEIAGGVVEADERGEPSGIVREAAAGAAEAQAGDLTEEEQAAAAEDVFDDLFRAGITALHDMSGTRLQAVLRRLASEGRLRLPVFATLAPADVARAELREPAPNLRVCGMKAFLDGALGTRTAHLLEPYEGDLAHAGIEVLPPQLVREFVAEAAAEGLPSYLHAIGNAAVRSALNGLAAAPGLRHRVEHAQMVHDDDLPRFVQLGVAASVQPVHMAEDAPLIHRHWGERSREAFPLRRLLDSGAVLAFGSDAPIETFDVLAGVRCAVRRTGRDGSVLHAAEGLTTEEALRAYTAGAAWAAGIEGECGALREDLRASLTLLSHDIVSHPSALDDCRVAATVIDGAVVFEEA